LSIGTGMGMILFYDLRVNKFLSNPNNPQDHLKLQASRGWIVSINSYKKITKITEVKLFFTKLSKMRIL
jgi:hypothetical protein